MNRQQYLGLHEALCNEARLLSERKNHDYAGKGGEAVFANFERVEAMGITSTEKGFLVRLIDKLSRLSSFEDAGEFKVKDESVRDTVMDVINYIVLYYAYKEQKKQAFHDKAADASRLTDNFTPSKSSHFNGWAAYDIAKAEGKAVDSHMTKYPEML